MTNLTPEQQQVVDKAAKKHATHADWDCKREPFNWTDQKEKKSFKEGISFALSTPSLYMGLMIEFAEWACWNYDLSLSGDKWLERGKNPVKYYTTRQLLELFFEHKNKKEDEQQTGRPR